jgi:hypothetical protein
MFALGPGIIPLARMPSSTREMAPPASDQVGMTAMSAACRIALASGVVGALAP